MNKLFALMPLLAAITLGSVVFAASPKMVCKLTGKEVKTCCCEQQKDGKFLCKLTGKTIDTCCCTTK